MFGFGIFWRLEIGFLDLHQNAFLTLMHLNVKKIYTNGWKCILHEFLQTIIIHFADFFVCVFQGYHQIHFFFFNFILIESSAVSIFLTWKSAVSIFFCYNRLQVCGAGAGTLTTSARCWSGGACSSRVWVSSRGESGPASQVPSSPHSFYSSSVAYPS